MCILGVPEIRAGAEPEGYNLSCSISLKKFFCFNLREKRCTEASRFKKDNKSHIFKHLHSSETCFDSYNSLCFKIIDKANSKFDLKIKEALHIDWKKPNLYAQQNHLALTPFHYSFCSHCSFLPLFVFLLLFFAFLFHLLFPLSLC